MNHLIPTSDSLELMYKRHPYTGQGLGLMMFKVTLT